MPNLQEKQLSSLDDAKYLSQFEMKIIIRKITQKYSMDKLMMMLDKKKLEALEEEFSHHPDGIKLGNFVWLMKAAINHSEEEKFDLVYGLQKLFAEIDINGDEHMEWGEFTQYIIDAVIQNPTFKGSGGKSRDLLQETKMMKYKKYFASRYKDKSSHPTWPKTVVWSQKFQSLMMIENNQKSIKLIDPEDLQVKFLIHLPPQKKEVFVIDIDYSNEHQTFGCIDSDCNMIFWDYFINLKICKQIKSPCLQHKMKYLKNHKTWLTMGQDNIIREYDLKRAESLILQVEGHTKLILDVIELTSPFSIASASLDHTIRIYSLVDKEEVSVLKEHTKGVRQLSYNPNFGGFILSVGFERNVYVWSPEVTSRKSLIGKLEGHTEIVVCANFLNLKPFCVSIDEKFNFRFWDVRTLACVQVITNENNSQVPIYGLFMFPPSHEMERFAILSKRLYFYDAEQEEHQAQASGSQHQNKQENQLQDAKFVNDLANPLMAEFNKYYLNFSIVTPHDIRIYNARDGKLQKIIQNLIDPKSEAPITSFCSDDRQRKFYIGDSAGGIRTYNISNGVFIKTVQRPFQRNTPKKFDMVNDMDSHEISSLNFLNLDNHNVQLLVTSSWDSSLQIFDEGEQPDESRLLRLSVGGHGKEDISCMTVSEDLALIATGSISGIVAIWDFESSKIENYCLEHQKSISSLFFMYPLSVLLSTCNEGYVCMWGLKQAPLDYRYKLLKKIRNNLEDPEMCYMKVNITCSKTKFLRINKETTNSASPIMMLGDDSGYVNQWDLSPIMKEFRELGFKDIPSISKYQLSFNPKKNAQVNSLSASKTQIFFAEQKARKVKVRDSVNYVKKIQWFAHKAQLNSITFLENPDGILTCSADRHVKLWSLDGQLWGDINLLKETVNKHWTYPLDWSEKKAREIEKVKRLMEIVDPSSSNQASKRSPIKIDENGGQVEIEKQVVVEEQIVFEQAPKKEKDKRELIDYLAKRQRRMDLEENQKRQHERQIMLQNQEQMRAQYVSNQMKYSENVFMDKFMQDVQKATDENYMGQMMKNSVINIMDQRFDGLIQASLKGESIQQIIVKSDGLASIPTNTGFHRQNTNHKSRHNRQESNKTLQQNSPFSTIQNGPRPGTMSNNNHQARLQNINYPKPIAVKKDKNKEFNQQMFNKIACQSQQLSTLVQLAQMDTLKYQEQQERRELNEQNLQNNTLSPSRSAAGFYKFSQGTPQSNFKSLNTEMIRSPPKVTFNEQLSQMNQFTFYDPSAPNQQQRHTSTAINYQTALKPFTPISQYQNPSNLKGALQNIKNSISTGTLLDSNLTSLQNLGKQQQAASQQNTHIIHNSLNKNREQLVHTSQGKHNANQQSSKSRLSYNQQSQQQQDEYTRPFTSAMTSQLSSLQQLSKSKSQLALKNNQEKNHLKTISGDDYFSPEDKINFAVKSSKLAETQRRQTAKIVSLATQVAHQADKLEYKIRKDFLIQKELESQKQRDLEDALSNGNTSKAAALSHSKSALNMRNNSNFKKSNNHHSTMNLISPKQRRCIIGFEGSSSSGNSKFLRKLNNFISQSNGPQSQMNDKIVNIRYQKGEGMRLLKLNYNKVQFDHKLLQTNEFGYKRIEPEPELFNIFKGQGIDADVINEEGAVDLNSEFYNEINSLRNGLSTNNRDRERDTIESTSKNISKQHSLQV